MHTFTLSDYRVWCFKIGVLIDDYFGSEVSAYLLPYNKCFATNFVCTGLIRLQQLLQEINREQIEVEIVVQRVANGTECYQKLLQMVNEVTGQPIRLLMDLPDNEIEHVIKSVVRLLLTMIVIIKSNQFQNNLHINLRWLVPLVLNAYILSFTIFIEILSTFSWILI